ncbi:MAG: hypothetical protein DMF04_02340 [Verrucomicrobia bacterium]|nr:MAG: hypothetical protein DMF04_02340 [Verrucomicrobiota bacterium]
MPPFDCEKHLASSFRSLRRRRNCFELKWCVEQPRSPVGPPLPGPLVRLKRWLAAHHMTLMAIADTPHSIALGSAIGIFFGFTPLWSMKTLLSIAVAWVFKSNKIAAAIAVTLHDIILPLMPAVYFWQYRIGMRVLHGRPEHRAAFHHLSLHDFMTWPAFVRVGWPLLLGSFFLAIPSAIGTYFIMRLLVSRARSEAPLNPAK